MNNDSSIKPAPVPIPQEKSTLVEPASRWSIFKQSANGDDEGLSLPFLSRVNTKDLVFFTREFSTLLNASVPIVQSLNILVRQTKKPKLKTVIRNLAASVQGGNSLSSALSMHPEMFSNLYVNLVKTGEVSGTLDKSLIYIADQLEKDYDLRRKIKGALTYPAFVIVAMIGVIAMMFIFVMPNLLTLLEETDAALPLTTKILIATTNLFTNYWWLMFVLLALFFVSYRYMVSKPEGRLLWDTFKLRIPIVGPLSQKIYLERFARNFAVLVLGGVTVVDGLKVSAEAVGNAAYRRALLIAAHDVENGRSLSDSLSDYPDKIPPLVAQMINVGESTSRIDEILNKVAIFYEREADQTISNLTSLLEPVIMIILGGMVAIIVAGVLLPIYNVVVSQ